MVKRKWLEGLKKDPPGRKRIPLKGLRGIERELSRMHDSTPWDPGKRRIVDEPHALLFSAMLERAVHDYLGDFGPSMFGSKAWSVPKQKQMQRAARDWIFGVPKLDGVGLTCGECCAGLGLDLKAFREAVGKAKGVLKMGTGGTWMLESVK